MIVYVVYYNELRGSVAAIFKTENKAKEFIKNGDGLYMDMIESYSLN